MTTELYLAAIFDILHHSLRFIADLGLLWLLWWVFKRLDLLEQLVKKKQVEEAQRDE